MDTALREGVAGDDGGDKTLHAVAVFGDSFHQAVDHNFVVAFELATEGVGQKFHGQVAGQFLLPGGDDHLEFLGRRKAFSTGDLAGGVDRATRIVLVAPASDGIEILQAKSNRIEDCVFYYKAPIRTGFRIGSDAMWQYHAKNYNPKHPPALQSTSGTPMVKKGSSAFTIKKV